MTKHVCKPFISCRCSLAADAPDDDCPIHGGGIADRCACGRFVRAPGLDFIPVVAGAPHVDCDCMHCRPWTT